MTNDFRYYNQNPDNEITGDCVIRAISRASGISYKAVILLLKATAFEHRCDELCVCCYHHLLEDVLDYRVKFSRGNTVGEIAKEYSNNIIIVRISGHLTCCKYGICDDTWDCTDEIVDCFWIVQ